MNTKTKRRSRGYRSPELIRFRCSHQRKVAYVTVETAQAQANKLNGLNQQAEYGVQEVYCCNIGDTLGSIGPKHWHVGRVRMEKS